MHLAEGSAGQKSLFDQFKQMDVNKKAPQFTAHAAAGGGISQADADLERRRQIYKNVRKEIEREE